MSSLRSMDEPAQQLVFFDTFSHESPNEITLDLIQFPSPIRISEIRVIPLGARVAAKFPNGDRLGATNPSSFDVSFFVNNLALSSSHSTFTKLGSLSYKQNVNISLTLDAEKSCIPTDGLLIRGAYNTLTIAVIGRITDNESIRLQSEASVKAEAKIKSEPIEEPIEEVTKPLSPAKESSTNNDADKLGNLLEDLSNSPARSNFSIKGSLVSASPFEDVDSPGDIEINDSIKAKGDSETPASDVFRQSTTELLDNDLQEILSPEGNCDDVLNEDLDSISDGELELIPMDTHEADTVLDREESTAVVKENDSLLDPIEKSEDMTEDLEQISSGDEDIFVKSGSPVGEGILDPVIEVGDKDSSSFELTFFDPLTDKLIVHLNDRFDPCSSPTIEKEASDGLSAILSTVRESFDQSPERWADAVDLLMSKYTANQLEDHWSFLQETVVNGMRNFTSNSSCSASHMSMSQVRQMKTSLKLTMFLLKSKSSLVNQLTENEKIWSSVLNLYHQPNASLPICLLVLSVMDTLTKSLVGIKFCIESPINCSQGSTTLYQWILRQIIAQPSSRILYNLERLLQRSNLFQLLLECTRLFATVSDEDGEKIFDLLENLLWQLRLAVSFAHQPLNMLPSSCVFSFKEEPETGQFNLFSWFDDVNLMGSLVKLARISKVRPLVSELITFIAGLPDGLTFMSTGSRTKATVSIIESLIRPCADESIDESMVILAYCLHGNYLLKNLLLIDENFEGNLYQMHVILSAPSSYSLPALVCLFSDDNNLKNLISLLWKPNTITNLIHEVAIEIILEVLRYRSTKVQRLLVTHSENLVTLSRRYHRSSPLREITRWVTNHLVPIEYNSSYFASLCKEINREVELVKSSGTPSPSLITLLRLAKEACIDESKASVQFDGLTTQLKYDYAVVELFSHDILQSFIAIIDCLSSSSTYGYIDRPHALNILTVLTFHAVVPLIHTIVRSLIRVRGKHFKDCTLIKPLLNVYAFLKSMNDVKLKLIVDQVSRETFDIISLYTQLLPDFDASTNVATSLWSKTLGECIEFTLLAPRYFHPGLSLLNQLMPLPLPICVPETIDPVNPSEVDLIHMLNMRKVWALHIHPVSNKVEQMITHLAVSSDEAVQHQLAQLSIKLCDLSLPSALNVTQGIVNVFELIKEQPVALIQWFKLLRTLSRSPSFKTTFLYIAFKTHTPSSAVSTVKFTPESCFFHQIATWINSSNSFVLAICQNLTNVGINLQYTDYCLDDANETHSLQETVNNLPPKESLAYLTHKLTQDAKCASVSCIKVLKTIATSHLGQSILISTLKDCTFVEDLLTEIGKNLNDESINLLTCLISLLSMVWTQKIEEKYVSRVSAIASLVKKWEVDCSGRFHSKEVARDDSSTHSKMVSAGEMSNIGKLIDRLLQQQVKVDKAVDTLALPRPEPLSVIFQRRSILVHASDAIKSEHNHPNNIYSPDASEKEATVTSSSSTSPISTCNTSHHLVNLIELTGRLFPLKSFDLPSELASLLIKPSATCKNDSLTRVRRNFVSTRRDQSINQLSSINHHPHNHHTSGHQHLSHHQPKQSFNQERQMVAPTRGRSSGPPGSKDPFRSRPPNTSRPPSMHVDDFVAMEQRGSSAVSTSLPSDVIRAQRGRNKDKRARKPSHRVSSRDLSLPAARFVSSRGTFPSH